MNNPTVAVDQSQNRSQTSSHVGVRAITRKLAVELVSPARPRAGAGHRHSAGAIECWDVAAGTGNAGDSPAAETGASVGRQRPGAGNCWSRVAGWPPSAGVDLEWREANAP